jgi:hypothetical protein
MKKKPLRILFWTVIIIASIILLIFISALIIRYKDKKQMKEQAKWVRSSDSLFCECSKKLTYRYMLYGNYIDYSYYKNYRDIPDYDTRKYYQEHYGVEFREINPKEDICVDRHMMDSVIDAKFGNNFYKSVYETNIKIINDHKRKTEPDSYYPGMDVICNRNEYLKFRDYIKDGLNKSFPKLSHQPPCFPASIEFVIFVGITGKIDSCYLFLKLSPQINQKFFELVNYYSYRFTPALSKETKKPVIIEFGDFIKFNGGNENPYFVHLE